MTGLKVHIGKDALAKTDIYDWKNKDPCELFQIYRDWVEGCDIYLDGKKFEYEPGFNEKQFDQAINEFFGQKINDSLKKIVKERTHQGALLYSGFDLVWNILDNAPLKRVNSKYNFYTANDELIFNVTVDLAFYYDPNKNKAISNVTNGEAVAQHKMLDPQSKKPIATLSTEMLIKKDGNVEYKGFSIEFKNDEFKKFYLKKLDAQKDEQNKDAKVLYDAIVSTGVPKNYIDVLGSILKSEANKSVLIEINKISNFSSDDYDNYDFIFAVHTMLSKELVKRPNDLELKEAMDVILSLEKFLNCEVKKLPDLIGKLLEIDDGMCIQIAKNTKSDRYRFRKDEELKEVCRIDEKKLINEKINHIMMEKRQGPRFWKTLPQSLHRLQEAISKFKPMYGLDFAWQAYEQSLVALIENPGEKENFSGVIKYLESFSSIHEKFKIINMAKDIIYVLLNRPNANNDQEKVTLYSFINIAKQKGQTTQKFYESIYETMRKQYPNIVLDGLYEKWQDENKINRSPGFDTFKP